MKNFKLHIKKYIDNATSINYLKPKFIYINVENNTEKIKKGDYIYKGQIINYICDYYTIYTHSPISGYVVELTRIPKGTQITIENDFKECIKYENQSSKNISKYSKDEFIEILRNCGVTGMSGSLIPTYSKYQDANIDILIINAVESDPFMTSDYCISLNKCQEILECIDAIMEINKIKKAYLCFNKLYFSLKKEYEKYIGTYPNIEIILIDNYYLADWDKNLIKTIYTSPKEKIVVNNISTIYSMYEALKYNKPTTDRIVTISSNEKKCNVLVKIGTNIFELLAKYAINTNNTILIGSPIHGQLANEKSVISKDTRVISVVKTSQNKRTPMECIKCGKCYEICPVKICPILAINNKLKVSEKCIKCGLCSYICPAKIKLMEQVIEVEK